MWKFLSGGKLNNVNINNDGLFKRNYEEALTCNKNDLSLIK